MKQKKVCAICGDKFSASYDGVAYCNKHYQSAYRYGTPFGRPRVSKNTYTIDKGVAKLLTTKGETFLVEQNDLEKTLLYTWCFSKTGYLVANINGKVTKLHRYLLNPAENEVVDHINGDPSDNRRVNLRVCTQLENGKNLGIKKCNTSGAAGIRMTPHGRYNVRITINNTEIHVGNYRTMETAMKARKAAEQKYFGAFAPSDSRKPSEKVTERGGTESE